MKEPGWSPRTCTAFVALGGRIAMTTRSAVEAGDVALLSNAWVFTAPDLTFGATTAEVARRDGGGTGAT